MQQAQTAGKRLWSTLFGWKCCASFWVVTKPNYAKLQQWRNNYYYNYNWVDLKNRTKFYLKKLGGGGWGFKVQQWRSLQQQKHISSTIKIRVKVQTPDTLNKLPPGTRWLLVQQIMLSSFDPYLHFRISLNFQQSFQEILMNIKNAHKRKFFH